MAATVLVGATIWPGSGPPIADGTLVVADGKVVEVGARGTVAVPPGAEILDVGGRVILPGLVDTHSHIGSTGDVNEMAGPLQVTISVIDALDPGHPSLRMARAGGVTTANVMPGSGNLVGGQTAYLKLRDADTIDELLLCEDRATGICGGLKMANGTNPQGDGAYPRTRMGAAAQLRALFAGARSGPAPADRKKKDPPLSPQDEILRQVRAGERVVHFHTHRADDVVTALALGRELGFSPVLHHVSEAWKVADVIAAAGAPCSLIVLDAPGGKEEALEYRPENAAILRAAGVEVAIHTDDPITDSRLLLRSAALAVRAGLSEEDAIRALTVAPARMLGLQDRIGALEPGKDADFVVLDGPPLSTFTHVLETWVEGVRVFDRSRPEDHAYAVGGWERAPRTPEAP